MKRLLLDKRKLGLILLVALLAGCATAGPTLTDLSWGYVAHSRYVGLAVNVFPNSRLCSEAVQADLASWNANAGVILGRPGPCQRLAVRQVDGIDKPVTSLAGSSSWWSFNIVGAGSTWQGVAVQGRALCVAAREVWKQAAPLTKTPCVQVELKQVP